MTKLIDEADAARGELEKALTYGVQEIERLRRENKTLAVKANAFDALTTLVSALAPPVNQAASLDAAWCLQRAIRLIDRAAAREQRDPAPSAAPAQADEAASAS